MYISTMKSFDFKQPVPNRSVIKTILLWNSCFDVKDCSFGLGRQPFFDHNCFFDNCDLINDRKKLPIDQYDAIVFHGPGIKNDFPPLRSDSQRYVYLSQESPQNYLVQENLNGLFNWTMTYRLDSDIEAVYFNVLSKSGNIIAPAENPQWITPDLKNDNLESFFHFYETKSKPIAWFVSNCKSRNQRERYVRNLGRYINVDIYGACGTHKCPRNKKMECFNMLKNDYYFYLSFENSNCKDYVTEKITNAMNNDVIPIVFGGANYTNFLPPHSYIDASKMPPEQLAALVKTIKNNQTLYSEYFWWKKYYEFKNVLPSFCKLCQLLNNNTLAKNVYNLHDWWNGGHNEIQTCY